MKYLILSLASFLVVQPAFSQQPLSKYNIIRQEDAKVFAQQSRAEILKIVIPALKKNLNPITEIGNIEETGGGTGGGGGGGASFSVASYTFGFKSERDTCVALVEVIYGQTNQQNGINYVSVQCASDNRRAVTSFSKEILGRMLAPPGDIELPKENPKPPPPRRVLK